MLPQEPSVFPEDLLSAEGVQGSWCVLHTRPRAEKSIARKFLRARLPFFLPQYEKKCYGGGRVRSAYLPLFPGYVFARGEGVRDAALATNQVAQVLPVPDQQRFHEDLLRIHRLTQAEFELTPEERLCVGTRVIITAGALADMCGKVLRCGTKCRFFVEIDFLGRGVSVEVESWLLRPVNDTTLAPAGSSSHCV
ncbi:hypothetical protein AYO40_03730 [Planctomycetaceae bacterium SCGC AG-212-D15]|nr:hypothetical protein AYO40_03730 [Planctomycetaceae bacterium SCGC AG-212-D15]